MEGERARAHLGHDGCQLPIDAWIITTSLDGHHHLLTNVRRLLGVRESRLGHLELVVLEFATHHEHTRGSWSRRMTHANE